MQHMQKKKSGKVLELARERDRLLRKKGKKRGGGELLERAGKKSTGAVWLASRSLEPREKRLWGGDDVSLQWRGKARKKKS